jgi:hypothetical protein
MLLSTGKANATDAGKTLPATRICSINTRNERQSASLYESVNVTTMHMAIAARQGSHMRTTVGVHSTAWSLCDRTSVSCQLAMNVPAARKYSMAAVPRQIASTIKTDSMVEMLCVDAHSHAMLYANEPRSPQRTTNPARFRQTDCLWSRWSSCELLGWCRPWLEGLAFMLRAELAELLSCRPKRPVLALYVPLLDCAALSQLNLLAWSSLEFKAVGEASSVGGSDETAAAELAA